MAKLSEDSISATVLLGSLNETIDLHAKRIAAYLYRAPAVMLLGLHLGALLAVLFMGFASGLDRRRQWLGMLVMVVLITTLLATIADLANGSLGAIQPSRQPWLDVQQSIGAAPGR